jgi:hypothetical protein
MTLDTDLISEKEHRLPRRRQRRIAQETVDMGLTPNTKVYVARWRHG